MSRGYLAVFLLLGLGMHGPAMGLEVLRSIDKPGGSSIKVTAAVRQAIERAQARRAAGSTRHAMRWIDGQRVAAFVYHRCGDDEPLLQNSTFGMAYVKLHYRELMDLAALPCVRQIGPPSYGYRRIGSVTSAGDRVMRVEEMREAFGVEGRDIRVGVISDSLINLTASVNTGDLPEDVIIVNGRDGSDAPSTTDEGRAMAELVHDLAPGATLLFHAGVPTSLQMIEAIRALTAAGAHIIVDDLGFFLEPYFEDGPVAQAVQEAIDAGVLYVTAVGNDAERNYRGGFQELDPDDDEPQINVHDFGGGDGALSVTIPAGGVMQAVLQWPNPFDGSANTADYDLFVFDAEVTAEACAAPDIAGVCRSDDAQLAAELSPVETVAVQNNSAQAVSLNLVVNRLAGEVLPLRLMLFGDVILNEHQVLSHSVYGHPCVREAMAVGAINAADPGFDTIEPFSSRGPCEIFFAPVAETGVDSRVDGFQTLQVVPLATPEIRDKPDVVAADGVDTSIPLFAPFFGTSAAAPHAAAVAALLMDLGGGPAFMSASRVLFLMRVAAVDLGASGVDQTYGFGAVDAMRAAGVLQDAPEATIVSPPEDIAVTAGDTVDFLGACSEVGSDGVFTFAWDFDGGANVAGSAAPNPSVTFPQPGTFTVTLTCSNALGLTSAFATVVVTVNVATAGGGGSDGGGSSGGGCTLKTDAANHPGRAFGNMLLLIFVLVGWRLWRRWRA